MRPSTGTLDTPVGLKSFEDGLGRVVEGIFGRGRRSNVRPIEIGRRLVHEMDERKSVDSKSRRVTANHFVVRLHPKDHEQVAQYLEALEAELVEAAKEYARDEAYHLKGPVTVKVRSDESVKAGRIAVEASIRAEGSTGAAILAVPGGRVVALASRAVVIGRQPECDVVLDDANISRRHAEVAPSDGQYAVRDLGSTNGTQVNGQLVTGQRILRDGDIISLGSHSIRFETK